jgi:PilZ domain-containing protein
MGIAWYHSGSIRERWVEKRRQPRKSVELSASLHDLDHHVLLASCQVLDISDGGARLKLSCPGDVPDSFVLFLHGKNFRRCDVRWRSDAEVGVQFQRDDDVLSREDGPATGTEVSAAKEEYDSRALDCIRLAEQTTDRAVRDSLLDEAEAWLKRYYDC